MEAITRELNLVSGGNPVLGGAVAVGAGVAAFNGGAAAIIAVDQNIQHLNDIGARAGQATFEYFNPNPMGQMTFTRFDFRGF
tara:strand:+ start:1640 stop:1885 length:246 start_codon:yes stop_codon:yes gene_type:complete